LKGDPLRLHYTSTLTDNNNVYGENVGKKVTRKKVTGKKSWMESHRKKSPIYNAIFNSNGLTTGDNRYMCFLLYYAKLIRKRKTLPFLYKLTK
jgi:hypothetical protein